MTVDDLVNYYGSPLEACQAIGRHRQNFTFWSKRGYVPLRVQLEYEKATGGDLKASADEVMEYVRKDK